MSGYNEYLNAGNNNRPTHRLSGIREQGTLSQRIHEWQSRVENVPPPAATRAMAGSRAPPSNFSDLRSASTGVSASSRGGGSTVRGSTMGGSTVRGSTMGGSTMGGSTMGGSTMGGSTMGGSTMGGSTVRGSTMGGSTMGGSTMGGSTMGGSTMGRSDYSYGSGATGNMSRTSGAMQSNGGGGGGGAGGAGREEPRQVPWSYTEDPDNYFRGRVRTVQGIVRYPNRPIFKSMDYEEGRDDSWHPPGYGNKGGGSVRR